MREFFQIPHVTIFRRIAAMADYIFSISPNFIKLPSEEEFDVLSNSFLELGRIPKTLLSIDGTHVKISASA